MKFIIPLLLTINAYADAYQVQVGATYVESSKFYANFTDKVSGDPQRVSLTNIEWHGDMWSGSFFYNFQQSTPHSPTVLWCQTLVQASVFCGVAYGRVTYITTFTERYAPPEAIGGTVINEYFITTPQYLNWLGAYPEPYWSSNNSTETPTCSEFERTTILMENYNVR
jgi:hypothetical protein